VKPEKMPSNSKQRRANSNDNSDDDDEDYESEVDNNNSSSSNNNRRKQRMEEMEARAVEKAKAHADAAFRPSPSILNANSAAVLLQQVDGPSLRTYKTTDAVYVGRSVPVRAGSRWNVPIHVSTPGSVVEYAVELDQHDVEFGITAEREEGITVVRVRARYFLIFFVLRCLFAEFSVEKRDRRKRETILIFPLLSTHGDLYTRLFFWQLRPPKTLTGNIPHPRR
jgi:hypothetical protein